MLLRKGYKFSVLFQRVSEIGTHFTNNQQQMWERWPPCEETCHNSSKDEEKCHYNLWKHCLNAHSLTKNSQIPHTAQHQVQPPHNADILLPIYNRNRVSAHYSVAGEMQDPVKLQVHAKSGLNVQWFSIMSWEKTWLQMQGIYYQQLGQRCSCNFQEQNKTQFPSPGSIRCAESHVLLHFQLWPAASSALTPSLGSSAASS